MEKQIVKGVVTEVQTSNLYKVELEDGSEIRAYMSGKMRQNKIRVIIQDTVLVELDPAGGKCTNRIIRRL